MNVPVPFLMERAEDGLLKLNSKGWQETKLEDHSDIVALVPYHTGLRRTKVEHMYKMKCIIFP